ncbi:helix-turn-helix domain-containing protein [Streptomyces sp. NPDC001270]|uniref:helix-turn-helix domain-containing protein n=1 Tax=Streptomyces sp. NPDC001270 TaxID=3364554 RepID=UPI0036A1156E
MVNHRRDPHSAAPSDETLGQWLTRQLEQRGYDLSQRGGGRARFAVESGVPVATVSRFLRDQGGADPRTLGRIAQALGLPVAPLLVKAGILPASELPEHTGEITQQEALNALGITSPDDQTAVMAMVRALLAKEGGRAT